MPPDKNLHKQRNSSGSVIPRSQFCYRTKTQLRLTDDVVQQTKHTQLSKLVDWNARQHNPISQHRPGRFFFPFDPPSDSTFMRPYPEAIVSNIARFIAVKRFPHADRIFFFFRHNPSGQQRVKFRWFSNGQNPILLSGLNPRNFTPSRRNHHRFVIRGSVRSSSTVTFLFVGLPPRCWMDSKLNR